MTMTYWSDGVLGDGPDGPVHRGRCDRLGAPAVALRRLPVAAGPRRDRLRRDCETVAALGHPGLAVVDDIVEVDDDTVVLATRIGDHGTLRDRLDLGPLPLPEAVEVTARLAGALAAAHGVGLTHRRLHAGNVLVSATGPVVTDLVQAAATGRPAPGADPVAVDVADLARMAHDLVDPADRSRRAAAYRSVCTTVADEPARGLRGLVEGLQRVVAPPSPRPQAKPGPVSAEPPSAPTSAVVALVVAVAAALGIVLGAASTMLPALGA